MTDNQFNQLFDLVSKSVNSVQRLERNVAEIKGDIVEMKSDIVEMKSDIVEMKSDIVEMKGDISELKQGQARMEKQMTFTNRSLGILQSDILNVRTRVEILEQEKELSS